MDPNDSPYGYVKTENEDGEAVFKRKRILKSNQEDESQTVSSLQPAPKASATSAPVPKTSKETSQSQVLFEISGGDGHLHTGIGLSAAFDHLELRAGASLFTAKSFYAGLDASARVKAPIKEIVPFVGAGGYGGDSKDCEETRESGKLVETCEKKFLSAFYLEAGLRFKDFALFTRKYNIDEAEISLPVKYLWGANFYF